MSFASSTFRWRAERADDEVTLRRAFWRKLGVVFAQVPFAEELLSAYYCSFDRATPAPVKAALLGALAYFVLPADAVPDLLPALGFTDDAAVLAAAIKLISSHMQPEHRAAARDKLEKLRAGRFQA